MPESRQKNRPRGIAIVAIFTLIKGVSGMVGMTLTFLLGSILEGDFSLDLMGVRLGINISLALMAGANFVTAYGLIVIVTPGRILTCANKSNITIHILNVLVTDRR